MDPMHPSEAVSKQPPQDVVSSPHPSLHLHKFFHFLHSIPVMTLRRIAKDWGRKQNGLKKILVARIYLFAVRKMHSEDRDLRAVLTTNPSIPDFDAYVAHARMRVVWEPPPCNDELLRIIGDAANAADLPDPMDDVADADHPAKALSDAAALEDPAVWTVGNPERDISLREFFRLLAVIRSDASVVRAIAGELRSVPALSSAETSPPESSGSAPATPLSPIWETVVQPRFNDLAQPFSPTLPAESTNESQLAEPVPHSPRTPDQNSSPHESPPHRPHRTATVLARSFYAARHMYMHYRTRWLRYPGVHVCFADVLPTLREPGGEFSAIGKRMMAFHDSLGSTVGNGIDGAGDIDLAALLFGRAVQDDHCNDEPGARHAAPRKRQRVVGMGICTRCARVAPSNSNANDAHEGFSDVVERELKWVELGTARARLGAQLLGGLAEARKLVDEYREDDEVREIAGAQFAHVKRELSELHRRTRAMGGAP